MDFSLQIQIGKTCILHAENDQSKRNWADLKSSEVYAEANWGGWRASLCFRRASQGHKHLFQGGLGQGVLIDAELSSDTLYNFKQGREVQTLHPAQQSRSTLSVTRILHSSNRQGAAQGSHSSKLTC